MNTELTAFYLIPRLLKIVGRFPKYFGSFKSKIILILWSWSTSIPKNEKWLPAELIVEKVPLSKMTPRWPGNVVDVEGFGKSTSQHPGLHYGAHVPFFLVECTFLQRIFYKFVSSGEWLYSLKMCSRLLWQDLTTIYGGKSLKTTGNLALKKVNSAEIQTLFLTFYDEQSDT